MVVKCSLCGKLFKNARGRHGHLNFFHGYARETPFTRAIRWEINRRRNGVEKPEVVKIKGITTRDEKRDKAIGVLREYEKSMAAMGDDRFIDEIDMEMDDSKFIDRLEFE